MKVVTAAEMQLIDQCAIEEFGIPGEILMGYAGHAVVDVILKKMPDADSFTIIAGGGNNGGDGFVIAWLLYNMNKRIDLRFFGDEEKLSPESAIYHDICKEVGVEVRALTNPEIKDLGFHGTDLIVDALFGTGFTGIPRGDAGEIIDKINSSGKPVCAVDIPSGLPADGAAPAGSAVTAAFTVTMGLPKISLVTYPGRDYTGELYIANIGFPEILTDSDDLSAELVNKETAEDILLPPKSEDVSKADRGHLLLVGGFDGMEGAIMMASSAAIETGVGLATLLTTGAARQVIAGSIPELITQSIPAEASREIIHGLLSGRRYDALVIGPGMGRSSFAEDLFNGILKELPRTKIKRVVIDGDGLFFLAEYLQGDKLPEGIDFIITPHFMEASRILGSDIEEIKASRFEAAKKLADYTGAITVLKGPASIIAGSEQCGINSSGCAAMATAGSGDVLAGIIGALLLKKEDVFRTACAGTWLHGRAGEDASADLKKNYLKATDIINYLQA